MSDAGLSSSDLHKVLLVGGSSRIPAVQEAVKKITGNEGFKGINPDECVAMAPRSRAASSPATSRACCCWMSPPVPGH